MSKIFAAVWRALSGKKTVLGVVSTAVAVALDPAILTTLPENWQPVVTGAGACLAAVGVLHKADKTTLLTEK